MKQPRLKVANLIAQRTLDKGVSKELSREIAAYLISEHRTQELSSLMRDVQAIWAEDGQVEVLASTAFPLSAKVKSDIEKQVKRLEPQAKRIIVTEVHDPSVIGGVRLNLADRQLDLSVSSKLHKFKQLATAGKE